MYEAALPTDSATASIMLDVGTAKGESESDVIVKSAVPHDLWVTAASEVTRDESGNVALWDSVLYADGEAVPPDTTPNASFAFTWLDETFAINKGHATFPLAGSADDDMVSIGGKLFFDIPSSGYKVNPSLDGFVQEGDTMVVRRGQVARIIWTISATNTSGDAYQDADEHIYTEQP